MAKLNNYQKAARRRWAKVRAAKKANGKPKKKLGMKAHTNGNGFRAEVRDALRKVIRSELKACLKEL